MKNTRELHLGDEGTVPLRGVNPDILALAARAEETEREKERQRAALAYEIDHSPAVELTDAQRLGVAKLKASAEGGLKDTLAQHIHYWERVHNSEADSWLNRLRGQTLLDLGCGRYFWRFQRIMNKYGPERYVGVDKYLPYRSSYHEVIPGFGNSIRLIKDLGDEMNGSLVKGDMLKVAARLPDASVSVALNGIDNFIVDPESEYGQMLQEEIRRVLHPDGIIFGVTLQEGLLTKLADTSELSGVRMPIENTATGKGGGFYFLKKVG